MIRHIRIKQFISNNKYQHISRSNGIIRYLTDADIDALEESFMQQRHLLIEARGRMQQEVKDIYTTAASQIRDIGLDAANLLVDGCKQDEVEEELQKSIRKAEDIIEKCQSDAVEVIDARLNEMGQQPTLNWLLMF